MFIGNLSDLTVTLLFSYSLIFCRISGALMLMPAFSDGVVPAKIRLTFALFLSVVVTPTLSQEIPPLPPHLAETLVLLGHELFVGIFIATCARVLFLSLEIMGTIFSQQTGLGNATLFNPFLNIQSSAMGQYLTLLGTVFIMITDLHHLMMAGLVKSYEVFPITPSLFDSGHVLTTLVDMITRSFSVALRMSAPIFILVTVFYVALGALNRLMPQMMIFFVAQPAQLLLGFFILALTIHIGLNLCLDQFRQYWQDLGGLST